MSTLAQNVGTGARCWRGVLAATLLLGGCGGDSSIGDGDGGGHAGADAADLADGGSGSALYPNEPTGPDWTLWRDLYYQGETSTEMFQSIVDDTGASWGLALNRNPNAELRLSVPDPTSPTGRSVGEFHFPDGLADGEDLLVLGAGYSGDFVRKGFVAHKIKYHPDFVYHALGVKMTIWFMGREGVEGEYTFLMGGSTDGGHEGMEEWPAPKLSYGSRGMTFDVGSSGPPLIGGEIFQYNVAVPEEMPRDTWITWEMYIDMGTQGQHDAVLRLWINGTLVTDYTGLRFPDDANNLGLYTMPFTWGGGGSSLTQDQWIRFANTRIVLSD